METYNRVSAQKWLALIMVPCLVILGLIGYAADRWGFPSELVIGLVFASLFLAIFTATKLSKRG